MSSNLPFTIFFLRGFFQGIPREYEEAFRLEGAGTMRVISRLIVPLSVPGTRRRVDIHLQRRLG